MTSHYTTSDLYHTRYFHHWKLCYFRKGHWNLSENLRKASTQWLHAANSSLTTWNGSWFTCSERRVPSTSVHISSDSSIDLYHRITVFYRMSQYNSSPVSVLFPFIISSEISTVVAEAQWTVQVSKSLKDSKIKMQLLLAINMGAMKPSFKKINIFVCPN